MSQLEFFETESRAYTCVLYKVFHHTEKVFESHHGAGGVTKEIKRSQIVESKLLRAPLISCPGSN